MKVLFVCLGNICRSPLAEAMFMHKVKQRGYEGLYLADSCGTSNYNIGSTPDSRTERNALKNGVRMNHEARQLSIGDFDDFDKILVMDTQNLHDVLSVGQAHHHSKVALVRTFDPLGAGDVPDPFYGKETDFQEVFQILDHTLDQLVSRLAVSRR